jgi:hypothetical protein
MVVIDYLHGRPSPEVAAKEALRAENSTDATALKGKIRTDPEAAQELKKNAIKVFIAHKHTFLSQLIPGLLLWFYGLMEESAVRDLLQALLTANLSSSAAALPDWRFKGEGEEPGWSWEPASGSAKRTFLYDGNLNISTIEKNLSLWNCAAPEGYVLNANELTNVRDFLHRLISGDFRQLQRSGEIYEVPSEVDFSAKERAALEVFLPANGFSEYQWTQGSDDSYRVTVFFKSPAKAVDEDFFWKPELLEELPDESSFEEVF